MAGDEANRICDVVGESTLLASSGGGLLWNSGALR